MSKVHVVADLRFKQDHLEEVLPLLMKLVKDTNEEKGCISYELVQDSKDKGIFYTLEVWESQADLDVHLNSEETKGVLEKAADFFSQEPAIHACEKLA